MKKISLIVAGVTALFFLTMCEGKDIVLDSESTKFEGIVQDSASGIPIAGALVNPTDTVTGFITLTTDSSGFFQFFNITGSDKLPFVFRKTGYVPKVYTLLAGQRPTIGIQKQ